MPLRALLWDVDGTLAETERDGHRPAFNAAFAEAGLPWHWEVATYGRLLAISGGRERISAFLEQVEGAPPDPGRVEQLQRRKQHHYRQRLAAGQVALRPGVARLLGEAAAAGLPQAIVTTSGRVAVQALLEAQLAAWMPSLPVWVCGEDVARKKPDPEAYRQACTRLGVAPAAALALEDSPQGLRAAAGAGVPCLVTRSVFTRAEPLAVFAAAAAVVDHLGEEHEPCRIEAGPPCDSPWLTLSYLERLLPPGP
ncbi:MAG: HAD-IA family hydrolase [Synechococcus sp.]|nr:HAD-IA family hydrolase [Synechococcus sp.]